jgi:hypothetical protein
MPARSTSSPPSPAHAPLALPILICCWFFFFVLVALSSQVCLRLTLIFIFIFILTIHALNPILTLSPPNHHNRCLAVSPTNHLAKFRFSLSPSSHIPPFGCRPRTSTLSITFTLTRLPRHAFALAINTYHRSHPRLPIRSPPCSHSHTHAQQSCNCLLSFYFLLRSIVFKPVLTHLRPSPSSPLSPLPTGSPTRSTFTLTLTQTFTHFLINNHNRLLTQLHRCAPIVMAAETCS